MIEETIQPIGIDLGVPTEEQIEAGANALQLNFALGVMLPFSQGAGQPPLVAPYKVVRVPISREQAESLAERLAEEAKKLHKQSQIITANSLEGVDKAVEFEKSIRGNG